MGVQDLSRVSAVAELERIGWAYTFTSDDQELKLCCPACKEKNPSCSLNVEKNVWKCHAAGCGKSGDIVTFLAHALKSTRIVILQDLTKRYELKLTPFVDRKLIEKYHDAIWNAIPFLKELRNRGLSDDCIRKYRLGFHTGRVTIPIFDESGHVINVRRYLPGAPSNEKMKSLKGHGRINLYPTGQLIYNTVIICGGEIKALAVAERLNEKDIGAVSTTGGEGSWKPEFSRLFKGKEVFICFDVDEAGQTATDAIAARVFNEAISVKTIELPLDTKTYPKGDVNDYFGCENATPDDFLALMESAKEWKPRDLIEISSLEQAHELALADCTKAEYSGRRITVKGIISTLDTTPYIIPKRVRCDCDRNQDFCSLCPVLPMIPKPGDRFVEMTLNKESPAILEMVNAGKAAQKDALRQGLRIPPCKSIEFKTLDYYNVEDVRISPQLDITTQSSEQRLLPAYVMSHGLEMNVTYQFTGRAYPHPRTQQAVLLLSEAKPTEDALSKYRPSGENLIELRKLQPNEWTLESLNEKLDDIYSDLEANVTRIFKRRDLHIAIDLAFHSVLLLKFDSRLEKGWSEILIVGDSAQGKTETSKQLMNFYRLGEKVECKNATVAGLLGGVQQLGSRWFVTWGVIPTHDRRLVVLEELKGASPEVIGSLTDMRSSGVAEIPKIERRRTHARTRLIALSNPRFDMPISAYNYGVEAIRELIGSPEDIRRFDYALVLSSLQIDPRELNKLSKFRPEVKHTFTNDMCRRCILWAWTRQPDQVCFDEKATELILEEATRLCEKYTDVIPLVDRGSMRLKLARLSAAIAARSFSTDDDDILIIRECHVQFIAQFIDDTYSDPVFGYADFSYAYLSTKKLRGVDHLKGKILAAPFAKDLIEQLLHTDEIELRDICDWCNWERGESMELLSLLVRKHALKRVSRGYRKNAEFIELLKELMISDALKKTERPGYIESSEEF